MTRAATIRTTLVAFASGAMMEILGVLWVHEAQRSVYAGVFLIGMVQAIAIVKGVGDSVKGRWPMAGFVAGYALGGAIGVWIKSWISLWL